MKQWQPVLAGVIFVAIAACSSAKSSGADSSLTVLTNTVEIFSLPPAELSKGYPARLEGIVTCFQKELQLCFIQDAGGGIFVYNQNWDMAMASGDRVEVEGITAPGLAAPILAKPIVKVLGKGPLPPGKPASIRDAASGREDSQLVAIDGIVHSQELNWGHLVLDLASRDGAHLKVRILAFPKDKTSDLVDASIRASGVVANAFGAGRTPPAFHLLVPDWASITVRERPAPDPFALPIVRIASLSADSLARRVGHRVHVEGVVTAQWPGHFVYVQDGDEAIRINTANETLAVQPGAWVEAVGFPVSAYPPLLEEAIFKIAGKRAALDPKQITANGASEERSDGKLIQIYGEVAGTEVVPGLNSFVLNFGEKSFRAYLPKEKTSADLEPIPAGSTVSLTGVCAKQRFENGTFAIWLRSRQDIRVLSRPFLWKSQWVYGATLSLLLLAGAAFFWAGRLRRQLKAKGTEEIRLVEAYRQSQQQVQKSAALRDRIARDLHDGIIQSIYAIGLNLDDCARQFSGLHADLDARLHHVRRELNTVVQDVRNFIVGLGPELLKGQEFKAALKSLVLTLGESAPTRFTLHVDPIAAEELSAAQATQLLHIAREALTNTIKHAQAKLATVSLQMFGQKIRFEVKDDGIGFEPNAPDVKWSGIKNMRGRTAELNGQFEIHSSPGQGTAIVLGIPVSS